MMKKFGVPATPLTSALSRSLLTLREKRFDSSSARSFVVSNPCRYPVGRTRTAEWHGCLISSNDRSFVNVPNARSVPLSDPQQLAPDQFGIVVLRELRKAGLDASPLRRERRSSLPGEENAYRIDYQLSLAGPDAEAPFEVLAECRRQAAEVGRSDVESLRARAEENEIEAAMLFATSGYSKEGAVHARAHGIALFRVADGRAAWSRSAWGGPSAPSWIPEFMLELADLGSAGDLRYELIMAGHAGKVLRRLEPAEQGGS